MATISQKIILIGIILNILIGSSFAYYQDPTNFTLLGIDEVETTVEDSTSEYQTDQGVFGTLKSYRS